MQIIPAEDIVGFLPADVAITGIAWTNNDEDLDLALRLPHAAGEGQRARLIARWVTDLRLDINFKGRSGVFPTWEVSITLSPEHAWSVLFDFGNGDTISFKCNDLHLEVG